MSTVAHTLTPPAGVLVFTALAASVHWLTVVLNAASDLLNLLLLVCVSFTIIGQPRNSVLIRRV